MYKYLLSGLLAISLFSARAQTAVDSNEIDLGRFRVKKNFTQTVTIKGKDLQQFPFTDLTEAINVWLSGYYTNAGTVVYIVDGLALNDVNAYSIYDIEEITLVQNASAQIAGATGYQQLILIKTKRKRSHPSGIDAALQENAIDLTGNRGSTHKFSLYQQYYISAYKSSDKLNAGLSADYLHDVFPYVPTSAVQVSQAPALNRFKLNGYLNAKLGKSTKLDITESYAPQQAQDSFTGNYSYGPQKAYSTEKEHLWNTQFKLNTTLAPNFINILKGGYNRYSDASNNHGFIYQNTDYNGNINTYVSSQNTSLSNHISKVYTFSDQLSYDVALNKWHIEPQVGFNYAHDQYNYSAYLTSNASYAVSSSSTWYKGHYSLLTPTLEIDYDKAFNLQGGVLINLNHAVTSYNTGERAKKTFPFVSATLDIAQLIHPQQTATSIKIFGSYSWSNALNDQLNTLNFFNFYGPQSTVNSNTALFGSTQSNIVINQYNSPFTYFKTLNTGINVGLFSNKLNISYNYQDLRYPDSYTIFIPYGTGYSYENVWINTQTYIHRAAFVYQLVKTDDLRISNGINSSLYRSVFRAYASPSFREADTYTGGFTNRINYHRLIAGADLLYFFGKPNELYNGTPYDLTMPHNIVNQHSVELQNLFVGYQLHTSRIPQLQLFASIRNLNGNKNAALIDYRRYIGIGITAGF